MNPDASVKALASTEVDVSNVEKGQSITVLWRGKPVFIRRRTDEEIKILAVDVIISEKNIIGNLVGTWSELYELMELANKGLVKLSMQEYKLDDANKALHDLNEGKVKGRAVLVP